MQGIIIAAGMGTRMGNLTRDKPKCLLKLGQKTLLELAVEGLKYAGCKEIFIITGYKEDEIKSLGYKIISNKSYKTNNILHSLMVTLPKLGIDLAIATPNGYEPDEDVMSIAKKDAQTYGTFLERTADPLDAVAGSVKT